MKSILLVLTFIILSATFSFAQRSQEMLTKKVMTASEVRANNALEKMGEHVQFTSEQREELADIIREFLDESQKANEMPDPQLAMTRAEAYRDKRAKRILTKPEDFEEFKKAMEELKLQQRGFGRK